VDLALGLATVGVVSGVFLGTLLINWAVWRGHLEPPDEVSDEEAEAMSSPEGLEEDQGPRFTDKALEPLSIHLGFVAVAIGVGWLLLEGLVLAERHLLVPLGWPELMEHIPLFPLAMIGGVLTQLVGMKTGFAGLGTLSLGALGENLPVLLVLVAGGIVWNLFGFWVLARLLFPRDWVASGLANFGQGMGMTVVGLLLVRMSDPRSRTGAMKAFGYKQLLFEPVVGGGLFTAASLPLVYQFGPVPVLAGTGFLMATWLAFGLWRFGPWAREGDDA
jgi:glutamate:Na+ symporter, ESS family